MLRAMAGSRRLIGSSTFPARPAGGYRSRRVEPWTPSGPSASVIAPERTRATVRSSSTRSISCAIMRSRKGGVSSLGERRSSPRPGSRGPSAIEGPPATAPRLQHPRRPRSALEQYHHAESRCRGMRLLAGSRRPCAHAFELILKGVIEQLVTVLPEKPEERLHACQPLHQHLLLRREICTGNQRVVRSCTSGPAPDHAPHGLS